MVMMTMHAVIKPCMCLIYRPYIDIKMWVRSFDIGSLCVTTVVLYIR